MHFTFLVSLVLSSLVSASAVPVSEHFSHSDDTAKVLKFPTKINNNPELVQMMKKRDGQIVAVDTDIHQVLLSFPLNLAGEDIYAVVDTGSRTTWFPKGNINGLCNTDSCLKSTNNVQVSNDDYQIAYSGNFGSTGKWSTAPLTIGGSSPVDFKFGLADSVRGSSGSFSWSGFSYDVDSSSNLDPTHIIDALKLGGAIDDRIFEIQYNDIENWSDNIMGHGSLTIGGYDTSKNYRFFQMLEHLPIHLSIPIKSISNSNGKSIDLQGDKVVVVDSGSTSLMMKQKYRDAIMSDIQFDPDYPGFFDCIQYQDYKVNFEIDDKTKIELPLASLSWNSYKDDYNLCQLMIGTLDDSSDMEIILGQYVLKNIDTVFNIDDKTIGFSDSKNVIFS